MNEDLNEATRKTKAARALLSQAVWETDWELEGQVSAEFEALGWKVRGWGYQSPCLRFAIRRDKYPVVEVDGYYDHLFRISREEGKLIEATEVILRGLCCTDHEDVDVHVALMMKSDVMILRRTRRFCEGLESSKDGPDTVGIWQSTSEEFIFLRELPKGVQEAARTLHESRIALSILRNAQDEAEQGLIIHR